MRKGLLIVLFLALFSSGFLSAENTEPAAFGAEIGGGSHLIVPDAYVLLDGSFPLGSSGFRLAARAGFSYIFGIWDDIHAGNIYFPAGLELMYSPMNLGISLLYYSSLSDIAGEGIFDAALRSCLELVSSPKLEFLLVFSLGLSAFWDYGTRPVFPVTAKIGFRLNVPFGEPADEGLEIPEPGEY